ncbi:ATP-binding protein [Coxiella burnetii]|uniref:ATP-binding protein n=1 Tax=Coxiella burnetii TaxID=777 RepID=UPI00223010F4|nr:ATP-binding protein [Coxiella burnetii]
MMMCIVDKFARHVSGTSAFAILCVIIVAHLITMTFYINDSRHARRAADRDAMIQKIINVINLLEATPVEERAKVIAAMNDPDMKASISSKPQFALQFQDISFWQINGALRKQLGAFAVSILLTKDQWLNINATLYTHFLLRQLMFFVFEIVAFGFILILIWSINRFTRPIENFRRAAERLSMDLNTQPVPIDGPSVVQEAARAMNRMQQRIQDLIRNRTQMLAAISHDLRTPITRMKLRAQFLDDSTTRNALVKDLNEMEVMINETLSFARDDFADNAKVNLDLVSLVCSLVESMQDMGYNIQFHSHPQRIKILGRASALKRAFTNLLNNAIRYAKNVNVRIQWRQNRVKVLIEDDGPGIAEKELEQVFEPFYRGEHSRSRDTGGVGLGLAVTRDIISDHNGKVILTNRPNGGLCATVELLSEVH